MQYDQAQGVYPQVAGSFYNVGGMSPHDNGRIASQVPTFSGGISGLMGANYAMQNFSGLTTGQSAMQYRASAMEQALASKAGIAGGLGLAATVGGGLASLGATGLLGMLGLTNPFTLPLAAAGMVASGYRDRIDSVIGLRNALQTSVFNPNMVDPFTGTLKLTTANQLNSSLKQGAHSLGMPESDLRKTLAFAGNSGMLANSSSVSDITSRVMDLAKVSKEIMQLGEGITAQDAMELQKLMSDMGIGKSKLKGMQLGKNLVQAARAANMSLDSVIQAAGAGAATYQQLGLGAAAGMNAATYTMMSANALSRSSNMDPTMLRKLGGAEGMQQALLGGAASTSARISDALVLGSLKMNSDGSMGIDYDLVDRYARGAVTQKDLLTRGTNLTKGMSNSSKAAFMQQLQFSMPSLKEQASDMLNTEQVMAIQGREILSLAEKSGLSVKQAAYSYFGDPAQAESFIAYSQDFAATRDARATQAMMSRGDELLRKSSLVKRGDVLSKAGRHLNKGFNFVGDVFSSAYDSTIGRFVDFTAATTLNQLEYSKRGMALLGSGYLYGGEDPSQYKSRGILSDISVARAAFNNRKPAAEDKVTAKLIEAQDLFNRSSAARLTILPKQKQELKEAHAGMVKGYADSLSGAHAFLERYGVDESELETFLGDDIVNKASAVFDEDSLGVSIGRGLSSLAPFASDNQVIRTADRLARAKRAMDLQRAGSRAYAESGLVFSTPKEASVYREYTKRLRTAYLNRANEGAGRVSDLFVTSEQEAKFKAKFLEQVRNRELGSSTDYAALEKAIAHEETSMSSLLGALNIGGDSTDFEQDTLKTSTGSIRSAGLDLAISEVGNQGLVSDLIYKLGRGAFKGKTGDYILNTLGIRPGKSRAAALRLIEILRRGTFTGGDKSTKNFVDSNASATGTEVGTRLGEVNTKEAESLQAEMAGYLGATGENSNKVLETLGGLGGNSGGSSFEQDTLNYLGTALKLDKRGAKYQGLANFARDLQDQINQGRSTVDDARNKLFQRIQSLSRTQDKTTPEGQGSSDLNSVMSKINEGLTAFNTALTQIAAAAASSESKEVTIKLKPSAN